MAQSFLHIISSGDDQNTVIAKIKNDNGWLREPEILNGAEIKVKEMRTFIAGAQKKTT